jgi:hypothetical protein
MPRYPSVSIPAISLNDKENNAIIELQLLPSFDNNRNYYEVKDVAMNKRLLLCLLLKQF